MKRTLLAVLTLSAAFGLNSASFAADTMPGQMKNSMCMGCHGIPGWRNAYPDVYPVPKIGGQHAQYIINALKQYKSGERVHQTMQAIASSLSEQDMADLAAYYSAKK